MMKTGERVPRFEKALRVMHDGVEIVNGSYWAICPSCAAVGVPCARCEGVGEVRAQVGDGQTYAFPVDYMINHPADVQEDGAGEGE